MGIELIGNSPHPTPEEINRAGELVSFNFEMTKSECPEYGLDNYRFVAGPSLELMAVDDCPVCGGVGFLMGVDCWNCDGSGSVEVGPMDPPKWRHTFGWYSLGPDGPPAR
jgi:hypothetical protein